LDAINFDALAQLVVPIVELRAQLWARVTDALALLWVVDLVVRTLLDAALTTARGCYANYVGALALFIRPDGKLWASCWAVTADTFICCGVPLLIVRAFW
jgi:hypothetical protein